MYRYRESVTWDDPEDVVEDREGIGPREDHPRRHVEADHSECSVVEVAVCRLCEDASQHGEAEVVGSRLEGLAAVAFRDGHERLNCGPDGSLGAWERRAPSFPC